VPRLPNRPKGKAVPGVVLVRDIAQVAEMILGEWPASPGDEGRPPSEGDEGCAGNGAKGKSESDTSLPT
jgi:hypothetical protein